MTPEVAGSSPAGPTLEGMRALAARALRDHLRGYLSRQRTRSNAPGSRRFEPCPARYERTTQCPIDSKLYIIVDADLAPGLQCAQACHALRAFVAEHPDVDRAWFEGPNNIVVLSVPGALYLEHLARYADELGVPRSVFTEPDLADQTTAIAMCGENAHRVCSSLPLALRSQRAA
jgi:Peptidyl-tRNA hydrolase PTH2